ncbi:2-phospho-L-lactate guanylyltransferase [Mycobacteroides chelonae]|uniref:2-phospho-L-lactate guanylyltransferase n=1 Tax=Mycobacteroides chelonae TaxID=1774 RepID=A0A1S1M5B7_MYCCH|nr:2-phospho-L-lactate guanylyltransferase [Mycobacteroides chelonae]OHU80294.1 2-phospho-L-lactate guanylyltransferase [Mycobacteroides chelonae]QQG90443.1 2-phospho-L-lactate guanylyltransferase [Mycobacteroides chelonae]QQG95260.1 2-phospho-L-lactate guanylyltransferase [Mycobacteroides chelonae]
MIIAVKNLATAKSRLAPSLPAPERERLVLGMLTHAISVAFSAARTVAVISPDPAAKAAAGEAGARFIFDDTPEGHPDPLNNALRGAATQLRAASPNLVVLQADLPAVTAQEFAAAMQAARSHARSFVADRHGTGTAALFSTDGELNPLFGIDSARRHRDSGAVELAGDWPGLRCDVDTPEDLSAARELGATLPL